MASKAPAPVAPHPGTPGSMGDIRRGNLALVLTRLAQSSGAVHLTRAQLAASTGLTKASVSSLVLELLDAGIVREIGVNPRGGERGRPGVGLELDPGNAVMGMEINVDYISAGLTDLAGNLLVHQTWEQDNRNASPAAVTTALAGLTAAVLAAPEARGVRVLGGGLAVPGLVDEATGTVLTAPNLGWRNQSLDLPSLLPGIPLEIMVFNEANAAAMAELRYRPQSATDFLFVSGEVGVGGGLVIGSELFTGPGGHAGELGHVVVEPEGSSCSCGGRGCLETVAGQDAIFAAAGISQAIASRGNAPVSDRLPAGFPGHESRSEVLAQLKSALTVGEPAATAALRRAGHSLGVAVASAARMFNISSVVLGGHFAYLDKWMVPAVSASLQVYAPGIIPPEDITVSTLGHTGALRGAASSVVRSLLEAPHLVVPPAAVEPPPDPAPAATLPQS